MFLWTVVQPVKVIEKETQTKPGALPVALLPQRGVASVASDTSCPSR